MQANTFLKSDNWWVENEKAFFCATEVAALFCVDMVSLECTMLAELPDCRFTKHQLNSYCIKNKNNIFCVSYEKKYIYYYDLEKKVWGNIEVGFNNRLMVCMNDNNIENNRIWLMEHRGKTIYQVNLDKKSLERKYNTITNNDIFSGQYIYVQHKLYCVLENKVFCIDTKSGNVILYDLPNVQTKLFAICYDGYNFWLSGVSEMIYVWNPQEGVIKKICNYITEHSKFFIHSQIIVKDAPIFLKSISLGENIWFIPLQCNAPIIFINKKTYRVNIFEIEEEKETEESILNRKMTLTYFVEYVYQNRYIGLYSMKNHLLFEIDTFKLCVKNRDYVFDNSTSETVINKIYLDKGFLRENNEIDRTVFELLLKENICKEENKKPCRFGNMIHQYVKNI